MNRFYFVLLAIWLAGLLAACQQSLQPPGNATPEGGVSQATPVSSPTSSSTPEAAAPSSPVADGSQPAERVLVPMVTTGEESDVSTPAPASTGSAKPTVTPAKARPEEPRPTPTPNYPVHEGAPLDRKQVGVQIHLHREDLGLIMSQLDELGVGWVKVQVSWKLFEPEPGRYDDYLFGELDRLVAAADDNDISVMLGVAKAPEWSRPTTEQDGPPLDYGLFESFMNVLATRYQGRVAAYELWNEANLQREWMGAPLSAASLVDLLRAGAAGVRAADPQAILISGAPATTGINDGVTAIDDRVYMEQMIAAGVATVVDAIGAHPYGWANPPDSNAAAPDPASPSHNNHPSFFYADTLGDYHRLLEQAGRPDMPIWVTEFGWGSYDGFGASPPPGVEYMAAVNEQQQAAYTLRAYEMVDGWPWVGPLILWNLNFAPTFGHEFVESAYSLLRPDGTPRPVYHTLSTLTQEH